MNITLLRRWLETHDDIHRLAGRSEEYIRNAADWNKETFQIDLFLKVLGTLPYEPIMIELGTSRFPTYSKAFYTIHPDGWPICTEVRTDCITAAKKILPGATWYQCYSGKPMHTQEDKPSAEDTDNAEHKPFVDLWYETIGAGHLNILHMDIQGSEVSVLQEIDDDNLYDSIDWFFVSIHGNWSQVHPFFTKWGCKIIYSHPNQGGYGDGLIVATNTEHHIQCK